MNNGFVKIPRTLIDLRAWKDNHPMLTPFEAYADLLQMAYYGREPQVRTFNHRQVTLHRGQFVGSRRYFMARWGWSEYQVRKALTKWADDGLLQTIQAEHTTIFTLLQADESTITQADTADPRPHSYPPTHPDQTHESPLFADTVDDKDTPNHPPTHPASHPNNKKIAKEEEGKLKPSKARASVRKSRVAFQPPTREQVEAYCMQQGIHTVDASRFVDYYEANGWHVGTHPMRSWQATVRNWHRRACDNGSRTFLASDHPTTIPSLTLQDLNTITTESSEPGKIRLPQTPNTITTHANPSPIPTTITSHPGSPAGSPAGSTAGSTAAPRIFPNTFTTAPITKRTACAEALVSYQARQARRVASMDAQEPDF